MGDTVLEDKWVENLPAHKLHNLDLINKTPNWERPGKVIFNDTLIGTELWLMTQEGKTDHSYAGNPDFSCEGKYLYTGLRRPPKGILRTDGSTRYINNNLKGMAWLFPWEKKYLPKGVDPTDWICTNRTFEEIFLYNPFTNENHSIKIPSRTGWRIVHIPAIGMYGGRGPKISAIDYETLVWQSDDRKYIGLSDTNGNNFKSYKVKSISAKPENDIIFPADIKGSDSAPVSSVWGKGGNNWRDAVDKEGNRYYLFEINRGKYFDEVDNPYQVWAISLTKGDKTGLLRVVPNPKVTITKHATTHTGGVPQPSFNWWELAAGLPRSGDNAIFLLENGKLLHMSSLGMHSSFRDTASVNDPYTGQVDFIGNYAHLDRITWPHEYRRDKDFATVESFVEPTCPVVMMDLEHKTLWTITITNFHDYAIRYRTRRDKTAYHKPMFRTSPVFSPDFTKISYFSSMLTGEHPDRLWADTYIAVARYPQPPVNLKISQNKLRWDKPRYSKEIEGYNLYRSQESGQNFSKVNNQLIKGTEYILPTDKEGFYVLTSVEYSGLESRTFSPELAVGRIRLFRHFYEAEAGKIKNPMVPFFEPQTAINGYAVSITDPELIYTEKLQSGLTGSVKWNISIPIKSNMKIMARVRGMSASERAKYTTGVPSNKEVGKGSFSVISNGKKVGKINVEGAKWHWVAMNGMLNGQSAGNTSLEFVTGDTGIAVDTIMVTNDLKFAPPSFGNIPTKTPSSPLNFKITEIVKDIKTPVLKWNGYNIKPPYIKLTWDKSTAPQGVRHYNIYRGESKDFEVSQSSLLVSVEDNFFIDPQLEKGKNYYYKVVSVDNWGNISAPSETIVIKID